MIHPPDPDSRRNMHVAMKVSIMTDGPGGLHFTQAVQTGTYGIIGAGYQEQFPNSHYLHTNDPQSRMLAWPAGSESSRTQTEGVAPIVETPVNTSKESDPYEPRGGPSPKIAENPESRPHSKRDHSHKHHHHHHHRRHKRSKSAGSERRSPGSVSSVRTSSIHTEDVNYNYDQFFKLDSVKNLPFQFVDQLGPTVPLLDKLYSDKPVEDPLPERGMSSNSSEDLYRPRSYGSDEILINTFSDQISENGPSKSNPVQPAVVLERETNLKQSLVVTGSDKNVIHKFDNIDKTMSLIEPSGHGVTRVQEIEATNDVPLSCSTIRVGDKKGPISLPDIVSVLMEPIVKLTEQLALAKKLINEPYDLEANEEANLEITTTLSAWKRDLTKPGQNPKMVNLEPNSAPLETLINDVGMESKEIQTSPEKFDSSVSTESMSQTIKEPGPHIFEEPVQRNAPLETLIDDVGVESKQVQTLPEKLNVGTNTDADLPKHPAPEQSGSGSMGVASIENLEFIHQKEPVKAPRSVSKLKSSIGVQAEESVGSDEQIEKYAEINKNESTRSIAKFGDFGLHPKSRMAGFIKSRSTVILKPIHPPPLPPPTDKTGPSKKPPTNYGGFIEQPDELLAQTVAPSAGDNSSVPAAASSTGVSFDARTTGPSPGDSSNSQTAAPSSGGSLFYRRPASSVEIFQLLTKDAPGKKSGTFGPDFDLYSEHIYEIPSFPPLRRDLYTLLELPESPKSDRTVSEKEAKSAKDNNFDNRLESSSQSIASCEQYSSDGYQSINSERSSISGILKKGDFKSTNDEIMIEENILDYSQEDISPIGKMVSSNESDGDGTPKRNSLASETSMKADESYELYSESVSAAAEEMARPSTALSSGPAPSLERSFDEIMQMAAGNSRSASHDQHIQRCYPKLYRLARVPPESGSSPVAGTPESEKGYPEPYSGKGNEPMIDNNNSSSSTLTSVGDYVRRNSSIIRTAEIVTQTLTRPEMEVVLPVEVSNSRDLISQIPPNLTVLPLFRKTFKQTSL